MSVEALVASHVFLPFETRACSPCGALGAGDDAFDDLREVVGIIRPRPIADGRVVGNE